MAARPSLILLAVFGSPVAHSLSPRIHRSFARQCGLEIDYSAIEVGSAAEFAAGVRDLAARGGRGCNVTVPYKRAAWELADRASDGATRARAANTLLFKGPADCYADNTDGAGLVDDLEGPLRRRLAGARLLLLGAGGAAAGVLAALLGAGAGQVVVANRTVASARELAERHADLGAVRGIPLEAIGGGAPYDLLLNATSLGHRGEAPPLERDWLTPDGLCYDLNYGPAAEPLRRSCTGLGLAYSDGLGMLAAQAARSFELWTGRRPEVGPVLDALRGAPGTEIASPVP